MIIVIKILKRENNHYDKIENHDDNVALQASAVLQARCWSHPISQPEGRGQMSLLRLVIAKIFQRTRIDGGATSSFENWMRECCKM